MNSAHNAQIVDDEAVSMQFHEIRNWRRSVLAIVDPQNTQNHETTDSTYERFSFLFEHNPSTERDLGPRLSAREISSFPLTCRFQEQEKLLLFASSRHSGRDLAISCRPSLTPLRYSRNRAIYLHQLVVSAPSFSLFPFFRVRLSYPPLESSLEYVYDT